MLFKDYWEGENGGLIILFDPKQYEAFDPVGTVENRVKAIQRHFKNALPITGVEGVAISRGHIGPAVAAK